MNRRKQIKINKNKILFVSTLLLTMIFVNMIMIVNVAYWRNKPICLYVVYPVHVSLTDQVM